MDKLNSFCKKVIVVFLETLHYPLVDIVFDLFQAFYVLAAFHMYYAGNEVWQSYPHNIIFNFPLYGFGLLFLVFFIVNLFRKFRSK